jgi:hypothetical protein
LFHVIEAEPDPRNGVDRPCHICSAKLRSVPQLVEVAVADDEKNAVWVALFQNNTFGECQRECKAPAVVVIAMYLLQRYQLPAEANVSRALVDNVAPEHEIRTVCQHELCMFRLRHASKRRVPVVPAPMNEP